MDHNDGEGGMEVVCSFDHEFGVHWHIKVVHVVMCGQCRVTLNESYMW